MVSSISVVGLDLLLSLSSTTNSPEDADKAESEFEKVFSKKQLPDEIPEVDISGELKDGRIWIVKLLTVCGHAESNGASRRLIQQGAVTLDGNKITDTKAEVEIKSGIILQTGKRKFARLKL